MEENRPIDRAYQAIAGAAAAQQRRLFLWVPVWIGAGVALYLGLRHEPDPRLAVALPLAAALGLLIGQRFPLARLLLLPLACAAAGFAAGQIETARQPPQVALPKRALWIEGRVRAVDLLPDGGRRLDLDRVRLAGGGLLVRTVRLTLRQDDPVTPQVGDRVQSRTRLQNPEPPSWPGGRDPQFEAYFAALAGSGRALTLAEDLGGGGRLGLIEQLRQTVAARAVAALPGDRGEIAATLMAGATAAVSQDDRADFAAAGLSHILAVAGLHMAIVMGMVFGTMRLLLVLVPRWGLILPIKAIAAGLSLLAGLGYLLLTGAHLPTERSFAMAALVVLGVIAGRRVVSFRGLAMAATVILLAAPHTLASVGFQMSFAAVFALIAGYRAMGRWFAAMQGWTGVWGWTGRHLVLLGVTSLLAGSATLPFAAASFGQIQLYYVAANLVAVPIMIVLVMPMVVVALLLMPWHAAYPALWLMGQGIGVIVWCAHWVAALPAAVVAWPPTPVWALGSVAFGMLLLGLLRGRVRGLGLLPLAVGIAAPWLMASPDFLLARDGRLVAVRDGSRVQWWQAGGNAVYELADWHHVWPRAAWQKLSCDAGWCRLRQGQVAVVTHSGAPDCGVRLILAVVPLRGACRGVASVDRFDVWRNGAYQGRLDGRAVTLLSDRTVRGARPWVR